MSRVRFVGFLVAMVLGVTGSASAQVREGSFKLSVETGLASFQRYTIEDDRRTATETSLAFGPARALGGSFPLFAALNVGYVAHRHLIPQLQFSFGVESRGVELEGPDYTDDGGDVRAGIVVLQPRIEVPFNPDASVVWSAFGGFDFRRVKVSVEDSEDPAYDDESVVFGFGPVAGIGTHVFLAERVSLDVAGYLQFNQLKVKDEEVEPDARHQLVLGLTLGLSVWP